MALVANIKVNLDDLEYTYPGGVERSADVRLQDYVSVMDYGAKGDGVTDDSAAINAALAAQKLVLFPAGRTYFYSSPITAMQSNAHVLMHGATLKPSSTVLTASWVNTGISNSRISGGFMEGTGLDNTSGNGQLMLWSNCSNCIVDGTAFTKSPNDGLRFIGCSNCIATNVLSYNNLSIGIQDRDGNYNSIVNCKCNINGDTGTVSNTGGRGILTWRSFGTKILGCDAFNNTEYGIRVYSQAGDSRGSTQTLISDCHAGDNLKIDIYVYNEIGTLAEIVIANPMIRRTTQPQGSMIAMQGTRVSCNGGSVVKSGDRLSVPCVALFSGDSIAVRGLTAGNVGQFLSQSSVNNTLITGCVVNCSTVGLGGEGTTYIGNQFTHGGSGTTDVAIDANTSVNHVLNNRFIGFYRCVSWTSQAMTIVGNISTGTTDVSLRMFGDGVPGLTHASNSWDVTSNPTIISSLYRTTNKGRCIGYSGAAPTALTWIAGDTIFNINPTGAGSVEKWVCTASGTPGTWLSKTL